MTADTVLVIDAGTSVMRAVRVRADGETAVVAREPWPAFTPQDAAPFGRELDAAAVESALGRLFTAAGPERDGLAAVAFTGQREGLVFLDGDGDAVCAGPNIDARASAEGMMIDAVHAAEVYATTGHLPSLMLAPAKLAWMRTSRADAAARIERVMPLVDWLASSVAECCKMSRSLAAENGLLDIRHGAAADGLLRALGMDAAVPEVIADGTISGEVHRGALAGLPVVLCGADTQCAILGAGAAEDGEAAVVAGWSAPLQLVTAKPVFDERRRTWTGVHVVPGRWLVESNAGDAGRAWDWLCGIMGMRADEADALATAATPGARDAMAVLGPRAMNAAAMTAGVGALTVPLPLVMTAPDRGELLRATLEAIAYAIRANLEQVEEVWGGGLARLGLGGGMSRSPLFVQILTDVIDRPVEVSFSRETSALGAAALAAPALGLHASLAEALDAMAGGRRTATPDAATSVAYEDYYERWCALCDALQRLDAGDG